MAKNTDKDIIVGLDIGTSKVVCLIAEISEDGSIEIIGFGSHPCDGLKKGVVVNIESTVQAIQSAIEIAETMCHCEIDSVSAGIAGGHITSMTSHGIVAVKHQEVTQEDVDGVIKAAGAVALPADQKILHVIPQEYTIDHQDGIKEPIGMTGVRLESKVHLVTASSSAEQNIIKCVRRCGISADNVILEQLASAESILTQDEKDLGVCLVDIGGGTTDIAVFIDGSIRHTGVIPIAGDQVTNDIAVALRTPNKYAEVIKINHGCALVQRVSQHESIEVPGVGDRAPRKMSRQILAEVLEPRYEELFFLVQLELRRSGFEEMVASGIVLTGGSSKIEGAVELAEEIFHMPVRLGVPRFFSGFTDVLSNPIYATSVGLLQFGYKYQRENIRHKDASGFKRLLLKMKSWFQFS